MAKRTWLVKEFHRGAPAPADGWQSSPLLGRTVTVAVLSMAMFALPTCGGDDVSGPDPIQSVVVTSPIENVMAVDRSVQLNASARDASGNTISGATVSWSSSDEAVARVDGGGSVEGLSSGTATITAVADGVSGSLEMRVVAAELETIAILLADPYTQQLVSSLGDAPRDRVQASLADCSGAVDTGHILDLRDCLLQIQGESATDPTDRMLLAVLAVIAERAELFLTL